MCKTVVRSALPFFFFFFFFFFLHGIPAIVILATVACEPAQVCPHICSMNTTKILA